MTRLTSFAFTSLIALSLAGCRGDRSPLKRLFHLRSRSTHHAVARPKPAPPKPVESAVPPPEPSDIDVPEMAWFPWIKNSKVGRALAQSTLSNRFVVPEGFNRIILQPESIGNWLRMLPLAAPGTVVADASGKPTVVTTAGFAAAVVVIDMHAEDSADALLRLHAEWRFSKGKTDKISYISNSGRAMPFGRWLAGERIVLKKQNWDWAPIATPSSGTEYADLRNFLDAAYQWVDPRALAIQGKVLDSTDVEPGDYLVHAGKDPTLVIVLDVAKNAQGEPAMLLGHVAAPRQSMYVMRASAESAWFMPRPTHDITAPGLKPFVWKEHHRLPKAMLETAK